MNKNIKRVDFEKLKKEVKRDWVNFFNDEDAIESLTEEQFIESLFVDRERNHLIIALAKNRNLWKWIDKTYSIRKHEYYVSYKNSFFYKTPLKEVFSLHTKEYLNKLAGIAYWCKENGTEEPLLKIIQKEHNRLYSRFKVGIKEFDLDRFIADKLSRVEKQLKNKEELMLDRNTQLEELITVTLFLSVVYDVEVEGFLWKKLYGGYLSGLFTSIPFYLSAKNVIRNTDKNNLRNLVEDILETDYKKLKQCANLHELYNLLSVEQNALAVKTASIMSAQAHKVMSLENIRNDIMNAVLSGENKEDILEEILDKNSDQFSDAVPTREFSTFVTYFNTMPRLAGLEKEALLDMPVDLELIERAIIYSLESEFDTYLEKRKKVDNTLRFQALTSITTLSMLEYFKNLELNVLDQEEELVVEIDKLNREIVSKDEEIAMLKEKIEQMNKIKKSEMNKVLEELELSKKNVKRLKKELETSKENEVEYVALKEYAYRNALSENEIALTFEDELSIEEKAKYLNERKVAVFGGHPNWVTKLKKILPDAMYIDTNAFSSRKFTRLDKYDLLVICNLFISHGLSWKVGEAIKNVKSKKVIIINDINTDLIINNMYSAVKEYEATY